MYWNGDNFGEFVVLNITQDTEPSPFPPVDSIWIQNLTKDNKLELSRNECKVLHILPSAFFIIPAIEVVQAYENKIELSLAL